MSDHDTTSHRGPDGLRLSRSGMAAVCGHEFLASVRTSTIQRQGMQHHPAAQHESPHQPRIPARPDPPWLPYLPASFISEPRTSGPGSTSPTSRQITLRQSVHRPTQSRGSDPAGELSQEFEQYASRDAFNRAQRSAASPNRARVDARALSPHSPSFHRQPPEHRPPHRLLCPMGSRGGRGDAARMGYDASHTPRLCEPPATAVPHAARACTMPTGLRQEQECGRDESA